jgi:hypothetical protein
MATGMARGAAARGKRIAFGDGRTISWDQYSETIFQGNPNIAPPRSEGALDLEWIDYRKGNRHYNRHDAANNRWIWNMDFRPTAGELFFSEEEVSWGLRQASGHVLIEPNVAAWKQSSPNKQWPTDRYNEVARQLRALGFDTVQFVYGHGYKAQFARMVRPPRFRHALAALARAALYIGPEGGTHHAAAALGVPAVVLFGGFIPAAVTGYEGHTNLTGGADACGSLTPCKHCADAMAAISVDEVINAALGYLKDKAA